MLNKFEAVEDEGFDGDRVISLWAGSSLAEVPNAQSQSVKDSERPIWILTSNLAR